MDTFFSNEFLDMLVRFLICVLVVWIIIDRFYSAKSKRRDFYFTFMLISIAIFFIVFFMIFVLEDMKGKTSMGIGIGLFGIFSIMRYRTDSMPVREMTYLFVTICLSVVNALAVSMSYYELVATNIIFIISVWLCEKRLKLSPSKLIQYDRIELIKPERREELVENLKTRIIENNQEENVNENQAVVSLCEIINPIKTIARRCQNIDELQDIISRLFDDKESGNSIMLSTVHKAKGLEAENVYIICPELLPFRHKNQQLWEIQQENNLAYVAITRAKNRLVYVDVSEDDIESVKI